MKKAYWQTNILHTPGDNCVEDEVINGPCAGRREKERERERELAWHFALVRSYKDLFWTAQSRKSIHASTIAHIMYMNHSSN